MEPGGVYRLGIDLHATSNYFGPGHRIRLEVSSSSFPRYDRNLNTGGNNYDETTWLLGTEHRAAQLDTPLVPAIADGADAS